MSEIHEVGSIEELVAGGEGDLKELADTGNSVASEWLERMQAAPSATAKLGLFGQLRIALLQDNRPEARLVAERMFPDERE